MKKLSIQFFPRTLTIILALTLVLIITQNLFAQGHKYIPFPDSAFIWRVVTYDLFNNKELNYQYFSNGDKKTQNGFEYIVVYKSNTIDLKPVSSFLVRNDTIDRKVIFVNGLGLPPYEGVLYDYNLKVGDTTKSPLWGGGGMQFYPEGLVVTKIDSIYLSDGWHQRWHFFENGTFDTIYPMIEGIGGRCGPFESPGGFEYASWLLCAMKESKPFFPNNFDTCKLATEITEYRKQIVEYTLFPNPALDEIYITSELGFSDYVVVHIYDLMGKELSCSMNKIDSHEFSVDIALLTRGLYFLHLNIGRDVLYRTRFIKGEE